MNQAILNILLILGFIIIVACVVYATYYFVKTLKSLTNLTNSVSDKLQMKALAIIPAILMAIVSKIIKKRR